MTNDRIASREVTAAARAAGWKLPERWEVLAYVGPNPMVFNPHKESATSNVENVDEPNPTQGFCRWCDGWIHKLDEDTVTGMGPDADGRQPEPGDWAEQATGIDCPGVDDRKHMRDHEPVAVRWWLQGKWADVQVAVEVFDHDGRCWGIAMRGGVKMGTYPHNVDRDTGQITTRQFDPLNGPETSVPQLIDEAMRMAQQALVEHAETAPVILGPARAPNDS